MKDALNPGRSESIFIEALPAEMQAEKFSERTLLEEVFRTMVFFGASFFRNSIVPELRKEQPTKLRVVLPKSAISLLPLKLMKLFLRLEFRTVMESIGVAILRNSLRSG